MSYAYVLSILRWMFGWTDVTVCVYGRWMFDGGCECVFTVGWLVGRLHAFLCRDCVSIADTIRLVV